jgi:hypothetical protein
LPDCGHGRQNYQKSFHPREHFSPTSWFFSAAICAMTGLDIPGVAFKAMLRRLKTAVDRLLERRSQV